MFWADKATAHGGIRRSRGYITVNHNDRGNIAVTAVNITAPVEISQQPRSISQHPGKFRSNSGKYHHNHSNIAAAMVIARQPR